ncbi:hypothetical protein ACUIJN_20220 [Metabacillus halosaccharovorans]|uniref:hypothetical protein n=1 Tax=Metabacillus halosaccharovorans TaxID=930124 RepID=UPI00403E048C
MYQLSLGLEWSTDERYEDYKQQIAMERKAERLAKRKEKQAAFLRGPEVITLLRYCEEPRRWGGNPGLYEHDDDDLRILFPKEHCTAIDGKGKLQKDFIPGSQSKRKYYMVKK